MNTSEAFETFSGFCSDCGSILPSLGIRGGVTCYSCGRQFPPEVFGNMEVTYTVHFNSKENYGKNVNKQSANKIKTEESAAGPVVERKCPKCGNEKMSYATLQLRSADEGQTVFYTCTKCEFKESENS